MKVITTRPNGTKRVYTQFTDEEIAHEKVKMADQSFARETDQNEIMRRHLAGQNVDHLFKRQGVYRDLTLIPDLQEAMEQVTHAQQAFMDLSADLRKRFGNNPVQLVEFLRDSANDEEAIKLGLKERKPGLIVPNQPEPPVGDPSPSPSPSSKSKSPKSKSPEPQNNDD